MQLCHTFAATAAVFDEPNLVSSAGLVPAMGLAELAGYLRTHPDDASGSLRCLTR
ncbi:hypothetical protein F4554_005492 [Actinopolymorpha rutila]|uniref:Uncharacterized protein n=1 Tax=Actinopolymorpha rutila TaxID=446787 RepID=A0A852ZIT1_9ACTN|nr:hypothetical protein [Actinopolymorpha rutila]